MSGKAKIGSLTSVRFFAALLVVFYHFNPFLPQLGLVSTMFGYGNIGVSVFFILSGFILTYTYDELFKDGVRPGEYYRFIRARVARVYPVYLLAFAITTVVVLYYVWRTPGVVSAYMGRDLAPGYLASSWIPELVPRATIFALHAVYKVVGQPVVVPRLRVFLLPPVPPGHRHPVPAPSDYAQGYRGRSNHIYRVDIIIIVHYRFEPVSPRVVLRQPIN